MGDCERGPYKKQKRNRSITEIVNIPDRGHALTIDHGWREVAETALDFVKRTLPSDGVLADEDRRDAHLGG